MRISRLSQKRIALMEKTGECVIVGGNMGDCTSVLNSYNKHNSPKKKLSLKKVMVINPKTEECVSAVAVFLVKEN